MACRARSALVQWVMCNPLATGSKQANSTIWTRWRGGKTLRSTRALPLVKNGREPPLLIAATQAPDGGFIALHLAGNSPQSDGRPELPKEFANAELETKAVCDCERCLVKSGHRCSRCRAAALFVHAWSASKLTKVSMPA